MTHLFFELAIYALWLFVFVSRVVRERPNRLEELAVLLFALPTTIIMEQRSKFVQAGTFYPSSIAYFPAFEFPIAIIFAGSLFAWSAYVLSRYIAKRLFSPDTAAIHAAQLPVFLVFVVSARLVEWFGLRIGYWQWDRMPDPRMQWIGSYLYYFWFSFPSALVGKFFAWYEGNSSLIPGPPSASNAKRE